jgi:hypothetical protein
VTTDAHVLTAQVGGSASKAPRAMDRLKKTIVNALIVIMITAVFTVGLDRVAGLFIPAPVKTGPLIFAPNTRALFRTSEFSVEAQVNSLGFRDGPTPVKTTHHTRVVAVGDSFAFGWGVRIEDAWPKVLERQLQFDGLDAEVLDLGQPGGYPKTFADVAERAIPLLHPDLVLVGMLDGASLSRSLPSSLETTSSSADPGAARRVMSNLRNLFALAFPNASAVVAHRSAPSGLGVDTASEWRDSAQQLIAGLTPEQRDHYLRLDPKVRQMLLDGDLNPGLVSSGIKRPDYYRYTLHPEDPDVAAGIAEVANQFERIKQVAQANGARVMVLTAPDGAYVSQQQFERRAEIGFNMDSEMQSSAMPDTVVEHAASSAGLPFTQVTDRFRAANDRDALYFEWDGHFTPHGHDLYATLLAPSIVRQLSN